MPPFYTHRYRRFQADTRKIMKWLLAHDHEMSKEMIAAYKERLGPYNEERQSYGKETH
jgi:hypothetical protein